jgi:hypothetical protein
MSTQVYEDTSGLTVGDPVVRTFKPLSVELGPGLLTTIFDGIQRPLKAIALSSGDVFIPRGVDVPALDRKKQYEFNPRKEIKVRCCSPPPPPLPPLPPHAGMFVDCPSPGEARSSQLCSMVVWLD